LFQEDKERQQKEREREKEKEREKEQAELASAEEKKKKKRNKHRPKAKSEDKLMLLPTTETIPVAGAILKRDTATAGATVPIAAGVIPSAASGSPSTSTPPPRKMQIAKEFIPSFLMQQPSSTPQLHPSLLQPQHIGKTGKASSFSQVPSVHHKSPTSKGGRVEDDDDADIANLLQHLIPASLIDANSQHEGKEPTTSGEFSDVSS
jgi:hypothetical protein